MLITIRSGLLAEIRWSVCMSKSHRSLCVSFSRTAAGLCLYHLFVWSNLNFLNFVYISYCYSTIVLLLIKYSCLIKQFAHSSTLPTQSCLVLYSFCANLLHSLIMWLIVSSFDKISTLKLKEKNKTKLYDCKFLSFFWFELILHPQTHRNFFYFSKKNCHDLKKKTTNQNDTLNDYLQFTIFPITYNLKINGRCIKITSLDHLTWTVIFIGLYVTNFFVHFLHIVS